jgi:hypothetical protein
MMDYLYIYVGLGVLILVFMLIYQWRHGQETPWRDLRRWDDLHGTQRSRWYRTRRDLLDPALTGVVVVMFWPVAMVMQAREIQSLREQDRYRREQTFTVLKANLLHPVRLEEVEATERVHDPLGAVPDLPFGHLNAAWRRFIAQIDLDTELWRFKAVRGNRVRTGYVLVSHGGMPGTYFLVTDVVPSPD